MKSTNGKHRICAILILSVLWQFGAGVANSAESSVNRTENESHSEHETITVSAALTWPQLINATVANYPGFTELAARSVEADALAERAKTWLAGSTSIYVFYQSDKSLDNSQLREYEAGFELPLWRPGQREAARYLATAASQETEAAAAAFRHEVIGFLRMALWDLEQAEISVQLSRAYVASAAERLRIIERRHLAGDLPLSDVLLARTALLERQASLVQSDAELVDAERAYHSLTDLNIRPASFIESMSERESFDDSHPLLALAASSLDRARSQRELIDESARGMPSLTLGTRRERGAFATQFTDSLGVGFTLPFGGNGHRNAQAASAGREVASAQSARSFLLRELNMDLHEARHTLGVTDQSLRIASEQMELAERQLQMGEAAFEQGEIMLFELLLRAERVEEAAEALAQLEIERERTIAEINQVLGEWP